MGGNKQNLLQAIYKCYPRFSSKYLKFNGHTVILKLRRDLIRTFIFIDQGLASGYYRFLYIKI